VKHLAVLPKCVSLRVSNMVSYFYGGTWITTNRKQKLPRHISFFFFYLREMRFYGQFRILDTKELHDSLRVTYCKI
jgi:hypothetical protein